MNGAVTATSEHPPTCDHLHWAQEELSKLNIAVLTFWRATKYQQPTRLQTHASVKALGRSLDRTKEGGLDTTSVPRAPMRTTHVLEHTLLLHVA